MVQYSRVGSVIFYDNSKTCVLYKDTTLFADTDSLFYTLSELKEVLDIPLTGNELLNRDLNRL